MAIDYTSNIGKVRVLTGDTNETSLKMSDEELQAMLELNNGVLNLAAANALESMAVKVAVEMGSFKTLDLQMNGPAVAKSLMDRAKVLRDEYQQGLDSYSDFEVVQITGAPFTSPYSIWDDA